MFTLHPCCVLYTACAERDLNLLLPAQIEGALFAALDAETNKATAGECSLVWEAAALLRDPD